MSEKFTTEPYFIDSFDHIPVGSVLTDKYNLDKDLVLSAAPNGAVLETADNIVIGDEGRGGGGCALFQEGGLLRKRIPGEAPGGTIGFAFFGTPKLGSSTFGFIRIWSDFTNSATLHTLEWTGAGFRIWSGNIFKENHFLPFPSGGPISATLRPDDWNYVVFGAISGEIHIPGAFTAHYLRLNGEVLYEAFGHGQADVNPRYFEIKGNEGWKIDDLWCSWHTPRIAGGDPDNPNEYLPRIPLEPNIRVLKANANGVLFNEFPTLVPSGLPIQRYEYIEGLFANKFQHIDSGTKVQRELHNFENVIPDLNIYAVQATMLMKGVVQDKKIQIAWLPSDQQGSPFAPFGDQGFQPFGYHPNRILSANTWAYYTGCSVNNTDSNPSPNLCDGTQWCPAEFNLSQFGVRNIGGSLIQFGHGIIEIMVDLPVPPPPNITQTILPWTHHRFTKLWKVVRPDGVSFRFTNHNITLINPLDGLSYTPIDALLTSAYQRKTGLDPNNSEIQGAFGTIAYNDFLAGKYNGTKISEFIIDWKYPWAGVFLATTFYIDSTEFDAAKWTVSTSGITLPLLRPKGHVYGRTCRHVLGDDGCKVDLTLLSEGASVLSVVNRSSFVTFDLQQGLDAFGNPRGVSGYWAFGNLTWTSGANIGLSSEIRSQTIGMIPENSTFVLQIPMPFDIAPNDTFSITPGCDKVLATCRDKFQNPTDGDVDIGNLKNYGGFPTIPGNDGLFAPLSEAKHVISFADFFDNPIAGIIGDFLF